ncbi:MAG: hypothetical protein ACKO3T_12010, partial [Planctomycetaceae bacterium]
LASLDCQQSVWGYAMIGFTPTEPPAEFDDKCRKPGLEWLAKHPKPAVRMKGQRWRPRDFWSPFRPQLATAFRNLCSIAAMHEPQGTVDHFVSCDSDPAQAYEWSNYRFVSAWLNSSKSDIDGLLDPFHVGADWFEISLPDLQLSLTNQIPPEFVAIAQYTLDTLPIRDDERIIRQRRIWYQLYQSGALPLEGLRQLAPLIARAVEKQMQTTPQTGTP